MSCSKAFAVFIAPLAAINAYAQSYAGIIKINSVDTVINQKSIHYQTFHNRLNHKKGLVLGRSRIECEVVIKDKTFAILPGNIDTRKVYLHTDLTRNDVVFNSLNSANNKDGMWVHYSAAHLVDSIAYYANDGLRLVLKFRKNGSPEVMHHYKNGQRQALGPWLYDRRGRVVNMSPDF